MNNLKKLRIAGREPVPGSRIALHVERSTAGNGGVHAGGGVQPHLQGGRRAPRGSLLRGGYHLGQAGHRVRRALVEGSWSARCRPHGAGALGRRRRQHARHTKIVIVAEQFQPPRTCCRCRVGSWRRWTSVSVWRTQVSMAATAAAGQWGGARDSQRGFGRGAACRTVLGGTGTVRTRSPWRSRSSCRAVRSRRPRAGCLRTASLRLTQRAGSSAHRSS